jgi:protein-S-isoprenylcysteine O-methyltransferase Ste14
MHDAAYGLWFLVILNSAIFIIFAFSFFKPQTGRDWRSFGAFSAFLVALFTEMYGFPLTIYFLAGWLQSNYPNIDWFAHDSGHLLEMLFGWEANPHFGPFHLLSFLLIGGGFVLLSAAWRVLYRAQQTGTLATTGPYARIRHPLVFMYWRLALREEREVEAERGEVYRRYAERVPRFIPNWRTRAATGAAD